MTPTLLGTTAVITGASSGIGAATARMLAHHGATVVLMARRKSRLDALVDTINTEGAPPAHAYTIDVTDPVAVHTALDSIASEHQGIDILVNCAGVGTWSPARDAQLCEWQAMIDVNIMGILATTHAALPHLVRAAEGDRGIADIVTVSSIAGRKITSPSGNVYAATKHAIGAFSEALRQELAPQHVRVGVIEPGQVDTDMLAGAGPDVRKTATDSGFGILNPTDVADAIIYMLTRPRHAAINEVVVRPTEQVM
jgi:NADP-dependent 3-hydroxy acid dehydrogenase YdfG